MCQNLPKNFPKIDRFSKGTATSIKSLDLGAKSYESASAVKSRVNSYIDDVASFNGAKHDGVNIGAKDITSRGLDLAVPGPGTPAQVQALNDAVTYGASVHVTVRIVIVP